MVISECQTQQDSIKDMSAKIKEQMDSGVDIATGLCSIKDFVYDDDDKFTFTSHIAIDGYTTYQLIVSSYMIKTMCCRSTRFLILACPHHTR
ncbi:hypothetical protein BASA61_002282 [Batrachochytrium salamandrivorans]|nr:hypothetical protein BASA61_002282 [Batrachochytrium salamandrivorans]